MQIERHVPKVIEPSLFFMRDFRCRSVAIILIFVVMMSPAQATEYWMASTDPYGRGPDRPDVAQDFLELFSLSANWNVASHRLTVLKFGPSFINTAPDNVLRQAFANLKRRGIAVGWEMGAIPPGLNCGRGEGYADDTARSVARIKAAGGELRYLAMDEPFWYGHYADTKNTCHLSIGDLARGVAARLSVVRAVFPDVQIGDIEPVGVPGVEDYPEQIYEWALAFYKATGRQLAFFHADIEWAGPWIDGLHLLQQRLSTLVIPVGVIIDGSPLATSNLEWTNAALLHLQQVTDLAGFKPETLIFQTWDDRPSKLLPEGEPGSLTNLVVEGSSPPAKITLIPKKSALTVGVTDISGKPIRDAAVDITARDVAGLYGFHTVERIGTVPLSAANAVFGLRVGVECKCNGVVDISVGPSQFSDSGAPPIVISLQDGLDRYHLEGATGTKVAINSKQFPVRAGVPYIIDVPLQVREGSNLAGYLAVFFLDADGREVRRDGIELQAAEQSIGRGVTDRNGWLSLQFPAGMDPSKLLIRARVESNKVTRSSVAEFRPRAE